MSGSCWSCVSSTPIVIEWLWESLLMFVRVFVILSIISIISFIFGVGYAWLQGAPRERKL